MCQFKYNHCGGLYPIFEIRNKTVQLAILFSQSTATGIALQRAAVLAFPLAYRLERVGGKAKERATRRRTTLASPSRIQTSVASEPPGCSTTRSTTILLALGSASISLAKSPTTPPHPPNPLLLVLPQSLLFPLGMT